MLRLANILAIQDKIDSPHLTRFRAPIGGILQMTIIVILITIGLGLAAASYLRKKRSTAKRARSLDSARAAGIALDDDGNINAGLTCAAMLAREEITGISYSGREREFLKLIQLISEGPQSSEDIRFLLENGYQPVVRPDGLVYVPCIENEHLSAPGEIELELEDLDAIGAKRSECV